MTWNTWCSDCFHSDSNGRNLKKEGDSTVFLRWTILQRNGLRGWEYSRFFFQVVTEYIFQAVVLTWRSKRKDLVWYCPIYFCGEAVSTRLIWIIWDVFSSVSVLAAPKMIKSWNTENWIVQVIFTGKIGVNMPVKKCITYFHFIISPFQIHKLSVESF